MGEIVAATGHRPSKLGGYGPDAFARLVFIASEYLELTRPDRCISGMALGWDHAFAQAAVNLGIPFVAAVPFAGQWSRWPQESQLRHRALLDCADEIVTVCDGGYAAWKMQRRNEWMVNNCTRLAALWNGSDGGTANCVGYAQKLERPIDSLWPRFAELPLLTTTTARDQE